jgi:hypothetical protein
MSVNTIFDPRASISFNKGYMQTGHNVYNLAIIFKEGSGEPAQ